MRFLFWGIIVALFHQQASSSNCTNFLFYKHGFRIDCVRDEIPRLRITYDGDSSTTWPPLTEIENQINFPQIDLELTSCPLPKNFIISDLRSVLGVERIQRLKLQNPIDPLNNHHLRNFSHLQELYLKEYKYENLSAYVFNDLTTLKKLFIESTEIKNIPLNIFSDLRYLGDLEITDNFIVTVKQKLFTGLNNLTKLLLSNNKLEVIEALAFDDLKSLKILDLSRNRLTQLPQGLFDKLSNLQRMSLSKNFLRKLPNNLFSEINDIFFIKLNFNQLQSLPENFFRNLTKLKTLDLGYNNLTDLPEGIFSATQSLESLILNFNNLTNLTSQIFKNVTNLMKLSLHHNKIKDISSKIFDSSLKLETLELNNNALVVLPEHFLSPLKNLRFVNLSNNELKNIGSAFCSGLVAQSLKTLDLSYNKLNMQQDGNPKFSAINLCHNLKELFLSHNEIVKIFRDWVKLTTSLSHVDLSHNKIKELKSEDITFVGDVKVYLRHNAITSINLSNIEFYAENYSQHNTRSKDLTLYLGDNPLECDCKLAKFVKFANKQLDMVIYNYVNVWTEDLRCNGPAYLKGKFLKELNSKDLKCLMKSNDTEDACYDTCSCYNHVEKKVYEVDCSYRNLTDMPPKMGNPSNFSITLNLTGNNLRATPSMQSPNLKMVERLILTGNNITSLTIQTLSKELKVLEVNDNKLSRLDHDVVQCLNRMWLNHLSLHGNPWICECEDRDFFNFVQTNSDGRISKFQEIMCKNLGKPMFRLTSDELCESKMKAIVLLSIILATSGLLIGIMAAIFYYYNMEIKVWLYSKKIFRWIVAEEDLDRAKKYHIFISYAHEEQDFVENKILPELENGPISYKVCVHYRDWLAGAPIPVQIAESVEYSQRTVIVVSRNFLKSVWGRMEFRIAHSRSIKEKRARVIIILYGDIDPTEVDEPDLKAYLNMNTYVRWGDPWFWEKLKYSLPHSNFRTSRRTRQTVKIVEEQLLEFKKSNQVVAKVEDAEDANYSSAETRLLSTDL